MNSFEFDSQLNDWVAINYKWWFSSLIHPWFDQFNHNQVNHKQKDSLEIVNFKITFSSNLIKFVNLV